MIYYVLTFANTHSAILTESHLKSFARVSMMPTLREISAGCGISLRFDAKELPSVSKGMTTLDLDPNMFTLYEISEGAPKKIEF